MSQFLCVVILVLSISSMGFTDEVQLQQPSENTEDNNRQLNLVELQLFSKLLSPNDTTLQQGTKSLLAKYIAAQIMNDNLQKSPSSTTNPNPTPGSSSTEASTKQAPTIVSEASTIRAVPVAEPVEGETTRIPRSTPAPAHVLNQVDKILLNVASGNIIGIVDESLAIRAPAPVRSLVNGILKLVFCNPLDRLMNRCRGSSASPGTGGETPTRTAQDSPFPPITSIFGR